MDHSLVKGHRGTSAGAKGGQGVGCRAISESRCDGPSYEGFGGHGATTTKRIVSFESLNQGKLCDMIKDALKQELLAYQIL